MQKTSRRNDEKSTKTKDDSITSKNQDENKLRSTPRTYVQKSSTTDIYGQKKKTPSAPKKVGSSTNNKTSPMSSLLKSSASSASIKSVLEKPKKVEGKVGSSTTNKLKSSASSASVRSVLEKPKKVTESSKTGKTLPFSNVTVNTPPTRRKLDLSRQNSQVLSKEKQNEKVSKTKMAEKSAGKSQEVKNHQRQKTRTLTKDEVKVLTPEIDNNAEMKNLLKLKAEPKAFFIDLEADKTKNQLASKPASPSPDVSYEDDFESYESDFESYHSDKTSPDENKISADENTNCSDVDTRTDSNGEAINSDDETTTRTSQNEKEIDRVDRREGKDEERMLDSGNFDLERRSATRPPMADIMETTESPDPDLKTSLPDEGFQEMSSSSGARSHVEVFERPLFIDFEKSKSLKKKRLMSQKMQQRAKDILSMIKLHEMSYILFEMQPIPYDLYMATYGKQNYTQTSAQTFDDGITEEIQTDDVDYETKWTQHPVKFSNFDHHFNENTMKKDNSEDFLNKFTFLFQANENPKTKDVNKSDERNNLMVFLEQKDGVGDDKRMSKTVFQKKLSQTEHNSERLKKFLKKSERRITNLLNLNSDKTVTGLKKSSFPFSKGYNNLCDKTSSDISFLKNKPISGFVVSKQNSSFLITIHNSNSMKSIACLWDITTNQPLKILTAIDSIDLSLFNGKSEGIFISALKDRSLHLWDLAEEPMIAQETPKLNIEASKSNTEGMTQSEIDREWNLRYSNFVHEPSQSLLQAAAYTSSAVSIESRDVHDSIVGMDFIDDKFYKLDGRKIIGQICTLQRTGILTTWLIVQQKQSIQELGKAYWSKMKLEKNYEIKLIDHIDPITDAFKVDFNLTTAKKRLSVKKCAKKSDANSAVKSRPSTARRVEGPPDWESGVLCSDIKVMKYEKVDCFLISKNCGEVWLCRKIAGAIKIKRFCVSNENSTITFLETSSNGLPYFLAATDAGTIHLCSLTESRVLLTLDCRNMIPESVEKCIGDHKGRYIGTVPVKPIEFDQSKDLNISSLSWSPTNPCRVIAGTSSDVATWDLTRSDIYATKAIKKCEAIGYTSDGDVILLTSDREVQLHRQNNESSSKINIEIFNKYVTLL